MAKAVLTTKINPTYDDLPEVRYHFPRTYLNHVKQALGDWIVYYEPRRQDADPSGREGRQAYFAAARLMDIQEDSELRDHYYGYVSDFLEFENSVPFREGSHYYESKLRKDDGSTNRGAFGRAVRLISDEEYDLILNSGFVTLVQPEEREDHMHQIGLAEESSEFKRPIHERLIKRPFRDAAFAKVVRNAYNSTCAMTGIKLINGAGRSEIDAAHIRPVGEGHNGPDSVRNGLALCKTVHWMFDRGLVSLTDDCRLLMARERMPEDIRRLFNADGTLRLPTDPQLRPHPQFLKYHRDKIFLGS